MNTSPEIFAYRINDTCHALGIGRSTLYKLIKEGQIRPITIGGRTLIPRAEIERLVKEGCSDE